MGVVSGWWVGALRYPTRSELWSLAQVAGGWRALERCGRSELVDLGVPPATARAWTETDDQVSRGAVIPRSSELYPASLAGDERAPPVLFVEGRVELLAEPPHVAVVGTRRCTERGVSLARSLAAELAEGGVAVVSGLALGIDAAAHAGSVDVAEGRAVAVLGHGLAHQSPASNGRLRARLIERGGAVVSGWPDDQPPERWTFVHRNRWVAGLAQHVVVVEAPVGSGALITARDALELGRDVWVASARPDDDASAGGVALVAEQEALDLAEIELLRLRLAQAAEGWDVEASATRAVVRVALEAAPRGRARLLTQRAVLLDRLGIRRPAAGPVAERFSGTPDEIARATGRPVREVLAELTRRELAGELVRGPSGRYDSP